MGYGALIRLLTARAKKGVPGVCHTDHYGLPITMSIERCAMRCLGPSLLDVVRDSSRSHSALHNLAPVVLQQMKPHVEDNEVSLGRVVDLAPRDPWTK
jgi:hypothetical protein